MARRLVLIRHAKAEGAHPRGDHERALTDRGVVAAVELGRWLSGQGLAPDHVLVSTAVRTRQTLDGLVRGLGSADLDAAGAASRTWADRRVYDGGIDGVLAAVTETPEEADVVWVVGHEPVMSTSTWELCGADGMPDGLREELAGGFPTATAAVLEADEVWRALGFGAARLVALHTARSD